MKRIITILLLLLWVFQGMSQDRLKSALDQIKKKEVCYVDFQNELKGNQSVALNDGEALVIMAYGNPSTGYFWTAESSNEKAATIENIPLEVAYEPCSVPGEGVYQRIIVLGAGSGKSTITLRYHRLWEKTKSAKSTKTIEVSSKGTYKGAFKYVQEKSAVKELTKADYEHKALPSSFDWGSQGKVSPVKDQGSCGSCWSFGLSAGVESKILMKDNVTRDLAEQYLVSCNQDGWGCPGGWWVPDMFMMRVPPGESGAGAVYESDMPYAAEDADCNPPHTHHEQINGWAYVDDIADTQTPTLSHKPTVQQIKEKLYQYGPIPSAMAIDNWNTYKGGVLTTDNSPTGTAHIVLITGWDDANQCWKIKNSWGDDWGESGYIRQKYGINNVWYGIYLKYKETNTPTLVWSGNEFYENKANNGGILNTLNFNLRSMGSGQGFYTTSGTLSQGTHYTVSNLPSGLSASIQVTSKTSARLTLSGYASAHAKANSISNLTVTFKNAAFSGISASSIANYNYNQLKINFWDPYKIVYKDVADISNSASDTWKPFNFGEGNSKFGLWYSYYNDGQTKVYCYYLEGFSKEGICQNSSTADGQRRLKPLPANASIAPSSNYWVKSGGYGNQWIIGSAAYQDWVGKTAYVGVRFQLNAGISYGWIRLKFTGTSITLLDYAYNQQPDAQILAGQKTGGTTTDTQAPSAPSNLQAGTATQTSVALSWSASTDNVGVTGYDVYRGSTLAGSTSGTSYTVSGLTCNTNYTFSVRAKDAAGNTSSASNSVSKATTACTTTSYCASKGSNVNYEWIAGVKVGSYTKTSAANGGYGNFTSETINITPGSATSVTLTPGFASSAYTEHWKIWIDVNKNQTFDSNEEFYSSSGKAAVSGSITIPSGNSGTTRMRVSMKYNAAPTACETINYGEVEDYTVNMSGGTTTDTEKPSTPTNLAVTGTTSSSISLSWNASTDNVGVTSYTINNATTNTNYTATTNSYTVTGLAANTNYTFYVLAKDAAGNSSSWSSAVQGTTTSSGTDTQKPSTPTNLTVTGTTSSTISISWTASTDNVGVASYTISNSTDSKTYTSSTNSYTVTGLTANKTYTFYVLAKDAAGNSSSWSSAVQGTTTSSGTDTQKPSTPSNLQVTGTTSSTISISWTASTDNVGVTSYTVNNATTNTNYTTTTNSYMVTGLAANTYYTFYVLAKDAAGNSSSWSSSLQGKTSDGGTGTLPNYCAAASSNGPEYISKVVFSNINNTSARADYQNHTSKVANVSKGSSYNLTVTIGQPYGSGHEVTAWIDWNIDGDFEDSGEKFILNKNSDSQASRSISVPSGAGSGLTGLRIRLSYNSGADVPCGNNSYGEVEDYAVNISSSKSVPLASDSAPIKVEVYPNPVDETLYINMPGTESALLKVINMNGNIVLEEEFNGPSDQVDVSSLASGMYNLSIVAEGNVTNLIVVIQ